jgi:hypothetical protein
MENSLHDYTYEGYLLRSNDRDLLECAVEEGRGGEGKGIKSFHFGAPDAKAASLTNLTGDQFNCHMKFVKMSL